MVKSVDRDVLFALRKRKRVSMNRSVRNQKVEPARKKKLRVGGKMVYNLRGSNFERNQINNFIVKKGISAGTNMGRLEMDAAERAVENTGRSV